MIQIYNSIYDLIISLFPLEITSQLENVFQLFTIFVVLSVVSAVIILPIVKLFKWIFGGF